MTIPEMNSALSQEESKNSYFLSDRLLEDNTKTIIKKYKPSKTSLLQQIVTMCIEYDLIILSRYGVINKTNKKKKDGSPVFRKKVTYAFQNKKTLEVYMNITLDCSPFQNTEKCYASLVDMNYLSTAKIYSESVQRTKLKSFVGSSSHNEEEGVIFINGSEVEKAKINDSRLIRFYNLKEVLMPIMYGFDINNEEDMYCLVDKVSLSRTKFGITNTTYDLHHMLVEGSRSSNKYTNERGEKVEPSSHLLEQSLKTNAKKIKDLMGTIILSQTAHKHQHLYSKLQGIEIYSIDELPYCLKNEDNYNEIIKYFGIENDEGYESFIQSQCCPAMDDKFINSDGILNKIK